MKLNTVSKSKVLSFFASFHSAGNVDRNENRILTVKFSFASCSNFISILIFAIFFLRVLPHVLFGRGSLFKWWKTQNQTFSCSQSFSKKHIAFKTIFQNFNFKHSEICDSNSIKRCLVQTFYELNAVNVCHTVLGQSNALKFENVICEAKCWCNFNLPCTLNIHRATALQPNPEIQ